MTREPDFADSIVERLDTMAHRNAELRDEIKELEARIADLEEQLLRALGERRALEPKP